MASQKIDLGRRTRMLKLAEEAKTILSSDTASPSSKDRFKKSFPWFHEDRHWSDDDIATDLMALAVLDDFSAETLTEILRANTEATDEPYLWLADKYDTVPDYDPDNPATGTSGPVDSHWRSPFIGCSVEEIATFIQAAPKPRKTLCKRFFAALQKEQYEQDQQLFIYKIPVGDDKTRLQKVSCPVHLAGNFFIGYDRSYWEQAVEEQALYFGDGAYWSDDDADNQVMALVVLDEFPISILKDNAGGHDQGYLWLADEYDGLPDYRPNERIVGTNTPIESSWQSPFVGKSLQDVANFIRNAPKPPKPLCKRFFAVLQKERFERSGELLVCKILPEGGEEGVDEDSNEAAGAEDFRKSGRSLFCKIASNDGQGEGEDVGEFEIQMIEIDAGGAGSFFSGFERDAWWELGDCNYD